MLKSFDPTRRPSTPDEVILLFKSPDYTQEIHTKYIEFAINEHAVDLDKFSLTMPGRLISPSLNLTKNATIDSIARIQFYATIAKSED